jgi:hypothetical protein
MGDEHEAPVIDLSGLAAETPEESLAAEHAATDLIEEEAHRLLEPGSEPGHEHPE